MRERMYPPNFPSEAEVRQLAKSGEVERLTHALEALTATTPEHQALIDKLHAITARLELAAAFGEAQNGLQDLVSKQPAVTRPGAQGEQVPVDQTRQEAWQFEQVVKDYLVAFRDTTSVVFEEKDKTSSLSKLQLKLQEAATREQALKLVGELQPIDMQWLQGQVRDTVGGVTEELWEAVQTGRACMATLQEQPEAANTNDFFSDWVKDVQTGILQSGNTLQKAVNWLRGTQ